MMAEQLPLDNLKTPAEALSRLCASMKAEINSHALDVEVNPVRLLSKE
jgi:hypothetical protein